jgi:hypothetical protein
MVTYIITDTHFGVKQNSITWLNSQLSFLEKQLIPALENETEEVKVVHMGDVFDSRSTISTMVASKVVDVFKRISKLATVEIIAGNHDFYSPNSDEIDTLNLLLSNIQNINIYSKQYHIKDRHLYIPWYDWGKPELQDIIDSKNIDYIFTHADVVTERIPYIIPKNILLFSGHLHIPDIKRNIYNIGAAYPLNFADANSKRGVYIIRNGKLEILHNNTSISFWRLYNDDIFEEREDIKSGDYIELYIKQSNMSDDKYMEYINYYTGNFKHVWIIPQSDDMIVGDIEKFEGYDIEEMIKTMIPKELQSKFERVLKLSRN